MKKAFFILSALWLCLTCVSCQKSASGYGLTGNWYKTASADSYFEITEDGVLIRMHPVVFYNGEEYSVYDFNFNDTYDSLVSFEDGVFTVNKHALPGKLNKPGLPVGKPFDYEVRIVEYKDSDTRMASIIDERCYINGSPMEYISRIDNDHFYAFLSDFYRVKKIVIE